MRPRYITKLSNIKEMNERERLRLGMVTDRFAFRTNEYYLSLIDWEDPDDPIRRIVVPDIDELEPWGELDASSESEYKRAQALEHKYSSVGLLLVSDVCGAFCRFCFRKRLFMNGNDEAAHDVSEGIEYIRKHPEITNVLLSGGDPLILSTRKLERIISELRSIDHVRIIRIGTKLPVFNPYRVLEDPSLPEMLAKYSTRDKRIYIITHFNHPMELTDIAVEGMDVLRKAGTILVNQTPLIRGVNDEPEVLAELFNKLSYYGIPPYYVFQCRPTLGNKPYAVPIEEGYMIFESAKSMCSGLAKRARYVMSHSTGKIEIVGLTDTRIYFKYHRAADPANSGKFMIFRRNPEAYWFDDFIGDVVESSGCFTACQGGD